MSAPPGLISEPAPLRQYGGKAVGREAARAAAGAALLLLVAALLFFWASAPRRRAPPAVAPPPPRPPLEGFRGWSQYRPACSGQWAADRRGSCRGLTTGAMPSIEPVLPISWEPCCGSLGVPPPLIW